MGEEEAASEHLENSFHLVNDLYIAAPDKDRICFIESSEYAWLVPFAKLNEFVKRHESNRLHSKPKVGSRVLAWVDDSWEMVDYLGPKEGSFAWVVDETSGREDNQILYWRELPPDVENDNAKP